MSLRPKHSGKLPKRSSNFELKVPDLFWKELRIPIAAKTWEALPKKQNLFRFLLKSYGKAFEKSRYLGKSVSYRIKVEPGRSPKIISFVEETPSKQEPASRETGNTDLQSALVAARERGQHLVAKILSSDDMLSADTFADLIGTSRVTINTKRQKRQVLALEGATRGFRFPKWQIGQDGKPFSALPKLFNQLGDDPWAVYRFLVQHHPELDGLSGREALQQGKTLQAVEAAESVARNTA